MPWRLIPNSGYPTAGNFDQARRVGIRPSEVYRRALALQITAVLYALRRDIEQFGIASSSGGTPGSPT
jgi:hypothetical protein